MRLLRTFTWLGVVAATGLASFLVIVSVRADEPSMSPADPLIAAMSLGINAQSAAVAGFTLSDAQTMLSRIQAEEELLTDLATQVAAQSTAEASVMDLESQLHAGVDDEGLPAALAQAEASLAAAQSALQQIRTALFDIAMEGFPGAKVDRIGAFTASMEYSVPLEYRAVMRTDEEWSAIARACTARSRAQRLGEDLAPGHAQLLAAVEAESDVVQAATAIATSLPGLQSEFDSLVSAMMQ